MPKLISEDLLPVVAGQVDLQEAKKIADEMMLIGRFPYLSDSGIQNRFYRALAISQWVQTINCGDNYPYSKEQNVEGKQIARFCERDSKLFHHQNEARGNRSSHIVREEDEEGDGQEGHVLPPLAPGLGV
jgi:hypothetical protein